MSISNTNQDQSTQTQDQVAQQRHQRTQEQQERAHAQNLQAAADQQEIHGRNILRKNQADRSQSTDENGNQQPLPGDSINLQYYV